MLWGTGGADVKVPFAKNPALLKVLSFMAARYSTILISSSQFILIFKFFYESSLYFTCSGVLSTESKVPYAENPALKKDSLFQDDVEFIDLMWQLP